MAKVLAFIAVAVGWGLHFGAYTLFFTDDSTLAFKERYYRPYSLLFVSYIAAFMGAAVLEVQGPWTAAIVTPFAWWLMSRRVKLTRFCETCTRPSTYRWDSFCSRCGARLPN